MLDMAAKPFVSFLCRILWVLIKIASARQPKQFFNSTHKIDFYKGHTKINVQLSLNTPFFLPLGMESSSKF